MVETYNSSLSTYTGKPGGGTLLIFCIFSIISSLLYSYFEYYPFILMFYSFLFVYIHSIY